MIPSVVTDKTFPPNLGMLCKNSTITLRMKALVQEANWVRKLCGRYSQILSRFFVKTLLVGDSSYKFTVNRICLLLVTKIKVMNLGVFSPLSLSFFYEFEERF